MIFVIIVITMIMIMIITVIIMIGHHQDPRHHHHNQHIGIIIIMMIIIRNWCTSDHTWCYPRWSNGFASPQFSQKPDSPLMSRRMMCSRYDVTQTRRQLVLNSEKGQKKRIFHIVQPRRLESCCQGRTSLRGASLSTLSSPPCPGPVLTSSILSPRWGN